MSVYIVAEIGINHNGDMQLCRKMIEAAKVAGADAVKFQNYKTEKFIGQRSEFWTYRDGSKERQFDMFKRCELSLENLIEIDQICDRIGIDWHSTPMCTEGLNELVRLGVKVLKNGSDCLQDLDLIRAMADTGLPTVISTGMATELEIEKAVGAFHGDDLVLLHCTSAYPAADEDMNVCRVKRLAEKFSCLSGLSDHSQGETAAVLSVAYGSVWVEKHFTLDKTLPGPDHWFSASPVEMANLVNAVRKAELQVGMPMLGMTETEKQNRKEWFV